ncbi:MAG TPA: VOC family protein [Terriglobales bacterium]|nr:VOC family protein [Terriglobales bacterium]
MKNNSASSPRITRVILYVKDIPRVAAFYQQFFSMRPLPGATADWLELTDSSAGCSIALHKASVAQKSGAAMKLVFGVADVRTFKNIKERQGMKFGVVHEADGVVFANAKDPAGNSIQISSRGLAT